MLTGGTPFIAHNAAFDSRVFRASTAVAGLRDPDSTFFCSFRLAQRLLDLDNYRLPTVAAALHVPLYQHHNAAADAAACAGIVLELANRCGEHAVRDILSTTAPRGKAHSTSAERTRKSYARSSRLADLPQPNPNARAADPFFGQVVVFTGQLDTMDRRSAQEAVAHHGAHNGNSVTKNTTILVAATTQTAKFAKAQAAKTHGQSISIIAEADFIAMLDTGTGGRKNSTRSAIVEPPVKARKPKRGTVLTPKLRESTPRLHRAVGVAMIVIGCLVGAGLSFIPGIGPFLFCAALGLGIYGNVVRRRIARTLEQETPPTSP